jgi:hypothetical protein
MDFFQGLAWIREMFKNVPNHYDIKKGFRIERIGKVGGDANFGARVYPLCRKLADIGAVYFEAEIGHRRKHYTPSTPNVQYSSRFSKPLGDKTRLPFADDAHHFLDGRSKFASR